MLNNNTYSNNSLDVCKEQIRTYINNSSLKVNSDDIVSVLTQEIDVRKFKDWLDRNENYISTKEFQHNYFKKAFMNELSKETFKADPVTIETLSLIKAMRIKGIKVTSNSNLYLESMTAEAYRSGMSAEDINDLNRRIIVYMKEGQTFDDYVALFKKSNSVKSYKIDWQTVEDKYQKSLATWNEVLTDSEKNNEDEMSWDEIMAILCPKEEKEEDEKQNV